jgi:hypothetical protein
MIIAVSDRREVIDLESLDRMTIRKQQLQELVGVEYHRHMMGS